VPRKAAKEEVVQTVYIPFLNRRVEVSREGSDYKVLEQGAAGLETRAYRIPENVLKTLEEQLEKEGELSLRNVKLLEAMKNACEGLKSLSTRELIEYLIRASTVLVGMRKAVLFPIGDKVHLRKVGNKVAVEAEDKYVKLYDEKGDLIAKIPADKFDEILYKAARKGVISNKIIRPYVAERQLKKITKIALWFSSYLKVPYTG